MIICNLAVLLAQRQLKITRVSNDTGISRTTLTALNQNESKGVQFETISTLCQYLKIKPSDFFQYLPFDIACNTVITKNDTWFTDVTMESLKIKQNSLLFDFFIKISSYGSGFKTFSYTGTTTAKHTYWGATLPVTLTNEDKSNFSEIWETKLTPSFQAIIWRKFKRSIIEAINESMAKRFSSGEDDPMILQMETNELELTTDFYTDAPPENFDKLPF